MIVEYSYSPHNPIFSMGCIPARLLPGGPNLAAGTSLAYYKHEETIGALCCGHEYHANYIKHWLLRKRDCPICRASIFPFT
ncbi:hypothetical protein KY284_011038 [Solanum tuberosum]|nr:hypothetical protein KY284_011038 [Solanum tuberosum]